MGIDNSITADFQTHFYVDSAYPEAVRQFHFFFKKLFDLKILDHITFSFFGMLVFRRPGFESWFYHEQIV